MVGLALSITFGGVVILHLPQLPDLGMLSMLVPAALFGITSPGLRILSGFALGLWLTAATATREMDLRIPTGTKAEMVVSGMVTGLPSISDDVHRFQFRVMEGDLAGRQLRLSWRAPEINLVSGQKWRLTVRVKAPSGSLNFGTFDYEAWLFLKRIHGTGYVLVSPAPELIADDVFLVDRIRFKFRERLLSVVPARSIGTFLALSLGDTSQLDQTHWDILNRTGTTHLLIVSGLHIGLVASISFLVFRFLGLGVFRVIFLTMVFTGVYALLAGWGLPVQRAFVMTLVFLTCLYFLRHVLLPIQLAVAGICVVVLDPLATLGNGFWLSFGAVCALVLALSGRVEARKGLGRWVSSSLHAQWVVFLCLLPVLGFTNFQLPLGSMFVNLIAIPAVGMLLVPLLLVSSILLAIIPPMGEVLLGLCSVLVTVLWRFLEAAASVGLVAGVGQFSLASCLVSLVGIAILLSPPGLVPRWPGLILLLVILAPARALNQGDLRLTFLDVGQGLSILMESANRFQLYDTGPTFGTTFSAARQLVIPSLQRAGGHQIDNLIISHKDNDHAGGLTDILAKIPVGRVIQYGDCSKEWISDSVTFRTFSVVASQPGMVTTENDRSCLLSIRTHRFHILLTGDIEASAEYALLDSWSYPVDVMSVPHHGSNSSSTPALLNGLKPGLAVVSSGFQNRFNHPYSIVLDRYRERSARVLNTASSGAIEVLFTRSGYQVMEVRRTRRRIWRR
jgi:competence protein ComEC